MKVLRDLSVISQPIVENESVTVISMDKDLIVDAPISLTKGNLFFLARNIYLTSQAFINTRDDITFQTTENFHGGGCSINAGRNAEISSQKSITLTSNVRDILMHEIRSTVPTIK